MNPGATPSRRPLRIAGEHFVVTVRVASDPAEPRLMMAIPKKLAPSSPVRNRIRRVIRESFRAAVLAPAKAMANGLPSWAIRIQLVKLPQDATSPLIDSKGRKVRPFARRPTDGALKRIVRSDIDALMHRVLARVA